MLRWLFGSSGEPELSADALAFLDTLAREHALDADERERLEQLTIATIHALDWEGCGGLEITPRMQVVIAGIASLLLLGFRVERFPHARTVLVYPTPYATHDGDERFGEAWDSGEVVLAWDTIEAELRGEGNGRNLVIHEFAHQLDMIDGGADGMPPVPSDEHEDWWRDVMDAAYDDLVGAYAHGHPHVLDTYGASDEAEFFAVAAEAFVERPEQLADAHPDVYELLSAFFQQDPVERRRRDLDAEGP